MGAQLVEFQETELVPFAALPSSQNRLTTVSPGGLSLALPCHSSTRLLFCSTEPGSRMSHFRDPLPASPGSWGCFQAETARSQAP